MKDVLEESIMINNNSVSFHHRNLHALATEMFIVYNKTSPENRQESLFIFPIKVTHPFEIYFEKLSIRFCSV